MSTNQIPQQVSYGSYYRGGGRWGGMQRPQFRINAHAPMADPQKNIGADPMSTQIRKQWGWGASPDTADAEIKAGWQKADEQRAADEAVRNNSHGVDYNNYGNLPATNGGTMSPQTVSSLQKIDFMRTASPSGGGSAQQVA
jgi:hypothetical protein